MNVVVNVFSILMGLTITCMAWGGPRGEGIVGVCIAGIIIQAVCLGWNIRKNF